MTVRTVNPFRFLVKGAPLRLFAICFSVLLLAGAVTEPSAATLETGKLSILSGGKRHVFKIEIARTPKQQERGLMFRRKMPADEGMLFVYPYSSIIRMWMKNTFIPLDMIFIGKGGKILEIAQRAVPHSTEVISSRKPAVGVLEVNGGTVSRLGIKRGDRVVHPAFAGNQDVPR